MNRLLRVNYSLYVGLFMVALLVILSIFGPSLAPHTLTEIFETHYSNGKIFAPPLEPFDHNAYPLGTDKWGYDLLTMVLNGLRHTIFISLAVTLIKMLFGTIIGIYIGTWRKIPSWLESFENSWSYVPFFLVLYFCLMPVNFGNQINSSTLIMYFIAVTSIVSMPSIISSVRKKSNEIKKSVFIEASTTLGAGRHRIIWKHIFPQMKESLLVMFILEIVYVITIMGQLALINIFIGGTIVRYDPLIYLSVTKEISGLVGSARGNLYGSTHILVVPLIILLITTLSFSLLANGLKNRYQSNYQRTPWIKTGFEPKLRPIRVQYEKKHWWSLTGEKVMIALFLLSMVGVGGYFYSTFAADNGATPASKAKGVENGSKADYELTLTMKKTGNFTTTASIDVKNKSDQSWNELVFYFIPNAFTKGHSIGSVKGFSTVEVKNITVNGKKADYRLENDTLTLQLNEKLAERDYAEVKITYEFTLPENGSGFLKVEDSYYLAQWYPMLATYQKGKWNKADYIDSFKTHHTDFSDFKVDYEIPKGYSIISSADKDAKQTESKGNLKIDRVREFYMAIIKDRKPYTTKVNGVEIRLFSKTDHEQDPDVVLAIAKKALGFYQEKIGKYPHQQLDIILDKGYNHEYPGVITIDPYTNVEGPFKHALVQGIAHQYFYGVVANDSYNEAWIGEGFSEFATNIYFLLAEGQGKYQAQGVSYYRMDDIKKKGLGRQYSNVPLDEVKHPGYIIAQPAVQMFDMIEDKYRVKQKDFTLVMTEYLSDYYHHFQYKEVDTSAFVRYTKDYFNVPTGYFNEWLDTANLNN